MTPHSAKDKTPTAYSHDSADARVIYKQHSYRLAEELINSRLVLRKEIESIIDRVKAARHVHGKKNQFAFSEAQVNEDFMKGFKEKGWEYGIPVIPDLELRADYRKERVQVEVQFGNAARFYADVMKFQLAYLQDQIDLGVEILPRLGFAKLMGSNLANYERAIREIDRFKFAITLPLWIIGVEPESGAGHVSREETKDEEIEKQVRLYSESK